MAPYGPLKPRIAFMKPSFGVLALVVSVQVSSVRVRLSTLEIIEQSLMHEHSHLHVLSISSHYTSASLYFNGREEE